METLWIYRGRATAARVLSGLAGLAPSGSMASRCRDGDGRGGNGLARARRRRSLEYGHHLPRQAPTVHVCSGAYVGDHGWEFCFSPTS